MNCTVEPLDVSQIIIAIGIFLFFGSILLAIVIGKRDKEKTKVISTNPFAPKYGGIGLNKKSIIIVSK